MAGRYLMGDARHETMSMPEYMWPPLRERFADLAGVVLRPEEEQSGRLEFAFEGQSYAAGVIFAEAQMRIVWGRRDARPPPVAQVPQPATAPKGRPRRNLRRRHAVPQSHPWRGDRRSGDLRYRRRRFLSGRAACGLGHAPSRLRDGTGTGNVWHEIMYVPGYMWPPLRERFAELAGVVLRPEEEQSGRLEFAFEGQSYAAGVIFAEAQMRIVWE